MMAEITTTNSALPSGRGNETAQTRSVLRSVIADDRLHARWLNTLSLLENTGARKISRNQNPELVTETVLRHAFEESRHAWYLKRQIDKLDSPGCPTFEPCYLFAARISQHYLHKLDNAIARLVTAELGLTGRRLRDACYLLVTYAIEVKADHLYGVYEEELVAASSPVSVRNILLEEKGHLEQMVTALEKKFDESDRWLERCLAIEGNLHSEWLAAVAVEAGSTGSSS